MKSATDLPAKGVNTQPQINQATSNSRLQAQA
jgi:hypothetical protein